MVMVSYYGMIKNQSYTHWHPYLIILIITNSTHLKRFIMWGNTIKLA